MLSLLTKTGEVATSSAHLPSINTQPIAHIASTADDTGFVESVLAKVQEIVARIVRWASKLVQDLPNLATLTGIRLIVIIIACALVALIIFVAAVIYGSYYLHPRIVSPSRAVDFDGYMTDTYMPRFMRIRESMRKHLQEMRVAGVFDTFALHFDAVPHCDLFWSTLPGDDDPCAHFLVRYFKCWSAYRYYESNFMRHFFPLDASAAVTPEEWERVETLKDQLRKFAASVSADNPATHLWMTSKEYGDHQHIASLSDGTPSQQFANLLSRNMAASGRGYEDYIKVAKDIAHFVTDLLEMHLVLNLYNASIVTKYDSRQRHAWGNPYIFYYFIGSQTILTGQSIKQIWQSSFRTRIESSYVAMHAWYNSIWPMLVDLPRMLASMDEGSGASQNEQVGPSQFASSESAGQDTGSGDVANRPSAQRIRQLMQNQATA